MSAGKHRKAAQYAKRQRKDSPTYQSSYGRKVMQKRAEAAAAAKTAKGAAV